MHKPNKELLGIVLDHLDVRLTRAQGRCKLRGHLPAGDALPPTLEPSDRTVGGEDGRFQLHLRRRWDNNEVFRRPQ